MTDQNSYQQQPSQPQPLHGQPIMPPNPYGQAPHHYGQPQYQYPPQPQYYGQPQLVQKSNTGLKIGLIVGGIVIFIAATLTIIAVVYVLYVFGAIAEGTTGKNPYTGEETSNSLQSPHQDKLLLNNASGEAEFLL